jgi:hypothetical protein
MFPQFHHVLSEIFHMRHQLIEFFVGNHESLLL